MGINSYAAGRRRLLSTSVEKEQALITDLIRTREGGYWALRHTAQDFNPAHSFS